MTANLQDPAFRLALYQGAGKICVWCKEPIVCYVDLQIDHLIYKTIDNTTLQQQIEGFELSPDYNVNETYNLAPIHGPCNRGKSNKPLPITALHKSILDMARSRAGKVEKNAEANKKLVSGSVSEALATLHSQSDDPQVREKIWEKVRDFLLEISSNGSGSDDAILEFSVLPDLHIAVDATGVVQALRFGDCSNSNCITGEIIWQTFPQPSGILRAGYCDACATFNVECPDCEAITSFFWEAEQECDECDNRFVTELVGGELWDVAVQRCGSAGY